MRAHSKNTMINSIVYHFSGYFVHCAIKINLLNANKADRSIDSFPA